MQSYNEIKCRVSDNHRSIDLVLSEYDEQGNTKIQTSLNYKKISPMN